MESTVSIPEEELSARDIPAYQFETQEENEEEKYIDIPAEHSPKKSQKPAEPEEPSFFEKFFAENALAKIG
jgi:hypothetical protein